MRAQPATIDLLYTVDCTYRLYFVTACQTKNGGISQQARVPSQCITRRAFCDLVFLLPLDTTPPPFLLQEGSFFSPSSCEICQFVFVFFFVPFLSPRLFCGLLLFLRRPRSTQKPGLSTLSYIAEYEPETETLFAGVDIYLSVVAREA